MTLLSSSSRTRARALAVLLCAFCLAACGAAGTGKKNGPVKTDPPARQQPAQPVAAPSPPGQGGGAAQAALTPGKGAIAAGWQALVTRLQSDDMGDPAYAAFFVGLPEYSPAPMAVKIKELFTNAFVRKKSAGTKPAAPPKVRIYKGIVTKENMERCAAFLKAHEAAFTAVEQKYPVPKEMIVALLFVETRLGAYLGDNNAFWSLAGMASATTPELVKEGLADLPLTDEHGEWLQAKLTDKSEWAYAELKALLRFCLLNNLDPKTMPGSVYGAVGLCQFMPSNLIPYGDDGDGDGLINLFNPPDAVFSTAKYLTAHGWKKAGDIAQQRKTLRRYNNLQTYANTIITLGESLQKNALQTAPSDAPKEEKNIVKKTGAKKGTAAKKTPARKAPLKKTASAKKTSAPASQPKAAVKKTPAKTTAKAAAPAKLGPRKIVP